MPKKLCKLPVLLLLWGAVHAAFGDESPTNERDVAGMIIIKTADGSEKTPLFFKANVKSKSRIAIDGIEHSMELSVDVIQGDPDRISLEWIGSDTIANVEGERIASWAMRRVGDRRFLDLFLEPNTTEAFATITARSTKLELPTIMELTHLGPGEAVGFQSIVELEYGSKVEGKVVVVEGFSPLGTRPRTRQFQSATGGKLQLALTRDGVSPAAVEFQDSTLAGQLNGDGNSFSFRLQGTANVTEANSEVTILAGKAAIQEMIANEKYRIRLAMENGHAIYRLVFSEIGAHAIDIEFVAPVISLAETSGANSSQDQGRGSTVERGQGGARLGKGLDFRVAAGAVVPVTLKGLASDLEFQSGRDSMVPTLQQGDWVGFLPASGRASMQWKSARKAGEGKLFFATAAVVEARVQAGLLRQDHGIKYQILQGELQDIQLSLAGPGEILDVRGDNVVSWNVESSGDERKLEISLSQPISGESQFTIRSQTPLGAFPVRIAGLRLTPQGAIRHSGFLRLANSGSVRLEPTALAGLTQLAPNQFPGEAIQARQVFVYRFPAADYQFTLVADRIQPEVNVSQLVLYELGETDRILKADIELDIREAPIRETDLRIPSDYSVVAVTGAQLADYVAATEVTDGQRNLKVIFAQDVMGRQLVSVHLEKTQTAAQGDWQLPRLVFPDAKTVRGDLGILSAPGYRINVGDSESLTEKPLSYFPKPDARLQQAFRIRDREWSATMQVEPMERSVQADVFHLVSLSQETVYGSALVNYFVTGAPVSEWRLTVPQALENVVVDGQDVGNWRREGDTLIVSLHQPVMGPYTLLITYEEQPDANQGNFQVGLVEPLQVQGERGYVHLVSPTLVEVSTQTVSEDMLKLDALELPAEFRLLSSAPSLGAWQYTKRPFNLTLKVDWFPPGTTASQIVEFAEATSSVSQDGELVTEITYYVKARGQQAFRVQLPKEPSRLWEATVNGNPVTARQTDDATLIPLLGLADPNEPVEVRLRLGKPTVRATRPELALPTVDVPVLKTQWNIQEDEGRVLLPAGGVLSSLSAAKAPSGLAWMTGHALPQLLCVLAISTFGFWATQRRGIVFGAGIVASIVAAGVCLAMTGLAMGSLGTVGPLQLNLPILSPGESVEMSVRNVAPWQANVSVAGWVVAAFGLAMLAWSMGRLVTAGDETGETVSADAEQEGAEQAGAAKESGFATPVVLVRCVAMFCLAVGILLQPVGAPLFFGIWALVILGITLPRLAKAVPSWSTMRAKDQEDTAASLPTDVTGDTGGAGGTVTALILLSLLLFGGPDTAQAEVVEGFEAANSIEQQWSVSHRENRLRARGTIKVSGEPGDRFLLLRAPATLTQFDGKGLRLTKTSLPKVGLAYVLSIPASTEAEVDLDAQADDDQEVNDSTDSQQLRDFTASFEYLVEGVDARRGIPVLTGISAVHEIDFRYDEAGWTVASASAVRIEPIANEAAATNEEAGTHANILLAPGSTAGKSTLRLVPKSRDVASEETRYFVEASNLFLLRPGVVDGRHRIQVRPSQGQVSDLSIGVPAGFTVSAVNGPVSGWRFDAEQNLLTLDVDPRQSEAFEIGIETQTSLAPLPTDTNLSPLRVANCQGEVGFVAVAFGSDAQPEKIDTQTMSTVNLGDFDQKMLEGSNAVLHRVYRYGSEGGELSVKIAPVQPEVRVRSKQVLSLGEERVVLAVNLVAEISRAGIFQVSFPLPAGMQVESLTGDSLHHWSELVDGEQQQIILHLNGKTIGPQAFSLTLEGSAPQDFNSPWVVPRFELNEASRQTGDLVVRPSAGIRLRTDSRQNVSETDPRTLGGDAQGALAFRLLQKAWQLNLAVEKLDAWVTGQVLHDVTLREGQTRSVVMAHIQVQNASIRNLQVKLPIQNEDEIKTVRAVGNTVSDLVRVPNSNTWEIQFKRRVIGRTQFQIEYERRGDRPEQGEAFSPVEFPTARQMGYHLAVRAGGRLELAHGELATSWQRVDWNSVPQTLRERDNHTPPSLVFRTVAAQAGAINILAKRHSLADSLKLRVAEGRLTTVLSPQGDQLTEVELTMEVIQRSSLSVGLPTGGELLNVFVNGESVNSVRRDESQNLWAFYVLPGIDDRSASVRFVYSVSADRIRRLRLLSPQLNVPLENIQWNVLAPEGFELTDHDGNLELVQKTREAAYNRNSYLSKLSGKKQAAAQQAAQLLEEANKLLQAGEQSKARWAFNNVANRNALDAASNEDARIQLENLQTEQAIVGLNTRRQRIYIDNAGDSAALDNQQLREAAAGNPILQQDQLNFRPQELSQLLRGNTSKDNAVLQQIAGRLVQHQRTTEAAPQAIAINLPEEGVVYTFARSVQVAENAPLELDLRFRSNHNSSAWRNILAIVGVAVICVVLASLGSRRGSRVETVGTISA